MTGGFKFMLALTIAVFIYKGSFVPWLQGIAEWMRWLFLGSMCVYALSSPRPLPGSHPGGQIRFWAFVFAALAVVSCLWSRIYPVYTFQRGVSVTLLVVLIFLVIWPRLRTLADYESLTRVLAGVGWVTALAGVLMYVVARGTAVRMYSGAFQGIFGNPNLVGTLYAVLLPVMVARFHYRKRPLTLAMAGLVFLLLVMCQSRAGLLGGVFGTGAFYGAYLGRKLWVIMLFAFMVLAPVVLLQERGASYLDETEQGLLRGESNFDDLGSGRVGLWKQAFKRFREHPFLGYGFGSGGDLYLPSGQPYRWHSSFTQISLELGIVGLFFFVMPMAYSGIRMTGYQMSPTASPRVRVIVAGLLGAWFGGAANSFFESWLFSVGNFTSLLAWICFAAGLKGMAEAGRLAEMETAAAVRPARTSGPQWGTLGFRAEDTVE